MGCGGVGTAHPPHNPSHPSPTVKYFFSLGIGNWIRGVDWFGIGAVDKNNRLMWSDNAIELVIMLLYTNNGLMWSDNAV